MVYHDSSPVMKSVEDDDDSIIVEENKNLLDNSWQSLNNYSKPVLKSHVCFWMTILSLFHLAFTLLLFPSIFSQQFSDISTYDARFTRNYGLMSLEHQYDHIWEELAPRAHFVYVSKGIKEGEEQFGKISMFHQLECLRTMREILQDASEGKGIKVDQTENGAWPHCLDYLVQTSLCHADDTMELPKLINGTRAGHTSGYPEFRQCRTVKPLYERVESAMGEATRRRKAMD